MRQAEENLRKFKEEQKNKFEIGEYASEILVRDSVKVPFAADLIETRKRIELALQASPDNPKVHRAKFLFHLLIRSSCSV